MEFRLQNFSLLDLLNSNKLLNAFTGIPTFQLLNDIAKCVEVAEGSSNNTKIPVLRVVLTMIKLKLNISFLCISAFFSLSNTGCRNYLKKNVNITVLQYGIPFPEKEEVLGNLRKCFEKYRNTRVVLDCTEIVIEKFNCLKCRIRSYSHYKGNHTVKFLIGTTPSGIISVISKGYGGRTSDKAILVQSKLLEKCIPNEDALMVDKGFQIEAECAQHKIGLIRPPFLKKKAQLSHLEAVETASIAAARVHIERSIQIIKLFNVFKGPIGQNLLPYVEDMVVIVAAVVNSTNPILHEDKFIHSC
uniref:Uncharacterized protein LOC114327206 n=1 Tax=Diabrotica virgifera virgifera TaxID=50390 RepID=A0A6P7F7R0_DIAVI